MKKKIAATVLNETLMAGLEAPIALPEYSGSILSTHMEAHNLLQLQGPPSDICGHMHVIHRHIYHQNPHRYKKQKITKE